MAATTRKPELLVIVGPTASGKSDLSLRAAKGYRGEIIAADSRTIYKGMDIGTAKPSLKDQKDIRHWGLDLVEPGQKFGAHQFKEYAEAKVKDIQERGNLPILVGGTGLYIDSVLFDFGFISTADSHQPELENLSKEELWAVIREKGYSMPENRQNRRHLISTIEKKGKTGSRKKYPKRSTLIIGLLPGDSEELKARITKRVDGYFRKGLIEETRELLRSYSEQDLKKTAGIAYTACIDVINRHTSKAKAKSSIVKQEWQYARRQRTWFRRNKFIQWFDDADQAYEEIVHVLSK